MNFTSEQIDSLISVSQSLMKRGDSAGVLEDLLDISMQVLKAERGFLVITENTDRDPILKSSRNIDPNETLRHSNISFTIIKEAMAKKESILTKNASMDPRFQGQESIVIHGIQSVACVPLLKENKSIGAIYMDSRGYQDLFTKQTINYLTVVGSFAVLALDHALHMERLEEQNRLWAEEIARQHGFSGIVGISVQMKRLFDMMARIAPSQLPVLILGESGTGKELISRAIHYNSPRKNKPFMALFCGNLSESLLESELFGHKKGAFTGATENKKGLLELADGGTFLLDEVADIPLNIQAKLLRFLQEGEIRPVGDNTLRKVNVRILAATNKNITKAILSGDFREDFYYRLNVLTINIPPLRERVEDIPLLAMHFLTKHCELNGREALTLSKKALRVLQLHQWPGNVRELENVIARAVVMCAGNQIDEECIVFDTVKSDFTAGSSDESALSLKNAIRQHIQRVLQATNGNRSETKRILGVSRSYLYTLMDEMKEDGLEI